MNDEPLLELSGVSFRYTDAASPVLDALDLSLARGESLAVTGPSGCGKSTLLNIIGTLEPPMSGSVRIEGRDVTRLDPHALAAMRNRKIGFVFQDHHLLPQCSLLENVLLPTLAGHGSPDRAPERARALLERVGLGDRMHHRPGEVSGGQRQRAAVIRALINGPALILADEPTGSLDRASADGLGDLLVEINRDEGVAMIVVTHAPDLAAKMSRRCGLRDGMLRDDA